MLQISQDFQLILETVEFLRVRPQAMLTENLGCQSLPVLQTQHLVDGGSGPASQLADGLETCMDTRLAQSESQHSQPDSGEFCELDEEGGLNTGLVGQSEPFEGAPGQALFAGLIGSGQYFLKGERQPKTNGRSGTRLLIICLKDQNIFILESQFAGRPLLTVHPPHGLQHRFSILE